jgi:GNAT superfamily N-acetyltransferase
MTITEARVEHLPGLLLCYTRLVEDGQAEHPTTYPAMDAAELDNFTLAILRNLANPVFRCWVAVDETEGRARVLGFLAGEIQDRAIGRPHRFAVPHWMYVHPAARAQGVGRALIRTAVAWALAQGITDTEVTALPGDPQWARMGFTAITTRWAAPLAAVAHRLSSSARAEARKARRPAPPVRVSRPQPRAKKKKSRRRSIENGTRTAASEAP